MLRRSFLTLCGLVPLATRLGISLNKPEILTQIPTEWSHAPGFNHKNSIGGYQIRNTGRIGIPTIFKWRGKSIRIPLNYMVCGNEYEDGTCYVSLNDTSNHDFYNKYNVPEVMSWGSFKGKV